MSPFIAHGFTNSGKIRPNNEDFFLIVPEKNLYIVSDGMGGHRAGEVASRIASEAVRDYIISKASGKKSVEELLLSSIRHADLLVHSEACKTTDYAGMGCTIVVCYIVEDFLYTCHVGDSRAYIINSSTINRITEDHSMVAQLVKAGEMTEVEARSSLYRNQLTQAVGSLDSNILTCTQKFVTSQDIILLCTDGLWDCLSDEEIFIAVKEANSLPQACDSLVHRAIAAGGYDNITAVLVTCNGKEGHPE